MPNQGIVASVSGDWCAAQARINECQRFQKKLILMGVPHFIPSIQIRRTIRRGSKERKITYARPLYGGYTFLPTSAVDAALRTTNIARVKYDNWPGRMRRELMAIEEAYADQQYFDADMKPGRMVRVAHGALEGIKGEISSIRRDRILFHVTILGRPAEMEMDVGDLELAS